MGQSQPLFVYFHSFLITISIQIEKSVDGVLGIQTRGRRMVGADKTRSYGGHPIVPLFCWSFIDVIFAGTFEDKEITHVEGEVDPIRDLDIINEELRLKDVEYFSKIYDELERKYVRGGEKKLKADYVRFLKKNLKSYLIPVNSRYSDFNNPLLPITYDIIGGNF